MVRPARPQEGTTHRSSTKSCKARLKVCSRAYIERCEADRHSRRPTDLLRPAVRCPSIRYNMKLREGRGFSIEEVKAAGIRKKEALSIGVAVDHRARSRSEERFNRNVDRLKAYKARLVVFPRNSKKPKKGDSSVSTVSLAERPPANTHSAQGEDLTANTIRSLTSAFPLPAPSEHEKPRAITSEEKELEAYKTLRKERSDARYAGARAKRAAAKEEAENATKK